MRTIDADALLERWCSEVCKAKPRCDEDCMFYDYLTIDSLSPTIEPEPHWIPCSERLPENSDLVITCSEFGDIEFGSYEEGKWYWLAESCSYYLEENNDEVIAWMPKPVPHREDGTEGR